MSEYTFIPIWYKSPKHEALRIEQVEHDVLPALLRARTTLAYLQHNNLLRPYPSAEAHLRWVLWAPEMSEADRDMWWKEYFSGHVDWAAFDLNKAQPVGGMLVLKDPTAGWTSQSPTLLLMEPATPAMLVDVFTPSMRWLSDRTGAQRILNGLWPIPTGQKDNGHVEA